MFSFPHCHPDCAHAQVLSLCRLMHSITVMLDGTHWTGNSHCCWLLYVAAPVCSASPLVHGDGNVLHLYSCSCAAFVRFLCQPTMWMCACRVHLYGDVYSSPGLDMKQKQLLMVAFLGQANMLEEMSGHALAVSIPSSHL